MTIRVLLPTLIAILIGLLVHWSQVNWVSLMCDGLPPQELPRSCLDKELRLVAAPIVLACAVLVISSFVSIAGGFSASERLLKVGLRTVLYGRGTPGIDRLFRYGLPFAIVLICFHVRFGFDAVVPWQTSWLSKGDPVQSYLGSVFFRREAWSWPIGSIESLMVPFGTNIGYVDGIPIVAVLAKLGRGFFHADWQYMGLWLLLGSLFFSLACSWLADRIAAPTLARALAASVLSLFPALLYRQEVGHFALTMMFHVPLALDFLLETDRLRQKCLAEKSSLKPLVSPVIALVLMLAFFALVHPYVAAMCLVYVGAAVAPIVLSRETKKEERLFAVFSFAVSVALTLLLWYSIGYFHGPQRQASPEYPKYFGANLNSLFNPLEYSDFLRVRPLATNGQPEGFGYVGLFPILAILVFFRSFERSFWFQKIQQHRSLLSALGMVLILSWGCLISFGNLRVELPIPIYGDVLSHFRSTGRFIWLVSFTAIFISLLLIRRRVKSDGLFSLIMLLGLLLQIADLTPFLRRVEYGKSGVPSFASATELRLWRDLLAGKEELLAIPALGVTVELLDDYELFWKLALQYDLKVNVGYTASSYSQSLIKNEEARVRDLLLSGKLEDSTVVVMSSSEKFAPKDPRINCLRNGKYTICSTSENSETSP